MGFARQGQLRANGLVVSALALAVRVIAAYRQRWERRAYYGFLIFELKT
jgi:hypothetical protein